MTASSADQASAPWTEKEACATFRPNTPEGLKPPRQMRFVFRQERRTRAAFAFPSAQDQVALA